MKTLDLSGQVFGLLTAESRQSDGKWMCACQCGNRKAVRRASLVSGSTRSCGCLHKSAARRRVKDLSGKRFGRLTAISLATSAGKSRWSCRCDCGNAVEVAAVHLVSGATQSCGCLHQAVITTHGMTGTKEYLAWENMKARASNPDSPWYSNVPLCDEWRDSFETFFADVGPAPGPEYSIDRIDPHGGYEPGNCRWATPAMQSRNQRWRNGKCPGVKRTPTGDKWVAEIRAGGYYQYVGTFEFYEDAVAARLDAEVKLWGEAYIN